MGLTVTESFHNTIYFEGRELLEADYKAKSQEAKILRFFLQNPAKSFGPSNIWTKVFDCAVPLTSVRRAMTNLTKNDDLRKLSLQVVGKYGMPEHHWMIASPWLKSQPEQGKLL